MAEQTDILEASIVLLGSFNPAIFSPAWFRMNDLISEGEFNASETKVVHPQVAQFSVEHLTVTAEPGKFILAVTSDPTVRIADLCVRLFRDLLPHIPVSAVGINYGEHWKSDTWQRRVALGRALAPISPWGEWGKHMRESPPELIGGMVNLAMQQPLDDGRDGHRRVSIEPSTELTDKFRGIHMLVNRHENIKANEGEGAYRAVELIAAHFDESIAIAKKVIEGMRVFAATLDVQ